jgi:hypothetical protein
MESHEARHEMDHRRSTHDRWLDQRNRRQEDAGYRDEWYAEQCGRCEFWVPLAGDWGRDFGGCSNPASPFDGTVRFEHDGCEHFSSADEWAVPEDFSSS